MTELKTDQQFTKTTDCHMGVTEEMRIAYLEAWDVAFMERNEFSDVALSQSIAAAINASGLPQGIARLRTENEALRRERDQAVQSYAVDRERFAAQEERHRVKITEQAERNRELEKLVERGIDGCECVCAEEAYFCEGFVKCWHCEAVETLAKHGRAGE